MISDPALAKQVNYLLLSVNSLLDHSVSMVQARATPEELRAYRRAAGAVMAELFLRLAKPLYTMHPDLKPHELTDL